MADRRRETVRTLRDSLLSENPDTFSAALREVLVEAAAEKLIGFRHASYVDDLALAERHYDALANLVLCLVYRHEWPPR